MNPDIHPTAGGGQVVAPAPAQPFKPCWYTLNLKGERPLGWWGHTVNYIDGKVYVSGGYGKHRTSEIYCIDTTCWESKKLPTLGVVPGHRDSHTCTTVGKNLLLVGGSDGNCKCCEVFVFDTEAMEWKVMQPRGRPPAPREGHSATVIGTKLVVFGGVGEKVDETNPDAPTTASRQYHGDLNFLDLAEGTWENVAIEGEAPSPRDSHATAAVGNRLVLFGGDKGHQYLDDVWALDMSTLKWTQMRITSPVSPGPRAGHVAVSVGNNILVVGGMGLEEERNNETWILRVGPDPVRNLNENQALWEVLDVTGVQLPPGRFSHAADIGDGCLFVIGGCSSSSHPVDDDLHILALSQEASVRVSAGLSSMHESRSLQRPVPIPLPTTQMQAPFSKSVGRPVKREHEGYPKKITSYNLFCSHHRSMLRDENPELTAREVERLMGQKWSSMVAEEKKPYEDEAYRLNASNMAAFKAQKTVPSDDVEPRVSSVPSGDADAKRHKPDSSAGPSGQVCRLFSPNPSLLGAQVEGHVDGAFNSGYLATVRVNGFTYRALLFSPYLALPTPIPANSPGLQSSSHPPHHHANHHEPAPSPVSPPTPQVPTTSTGHVRAGFMPQMMDGAISQGAAHGSIAQPEAHHPVMVAPEQGDTRNQFQVSAPAAVANGAGEDPADGQLRNPAGAGIVVDGMHDENHK